MGIPVLRRVADLGDGLVLAPERFDPRRHVEVVARCCLSDLVDIVAENVSARSWKSPGAVLILDTTHAYEGFVVFRHDPVPPASMAAPSVGCRLVTSSSRACGPTFGKWR